MKNTSELVKSLNGYFSWNKARMNCFVHMLLGMIAVRTVNLQEMALSFNSHAAVESRYRRLQRFFALFDVDMVNIARWIFRLFLSDRDRFYLIIDRTNWYWGKKKINVFMLSVSYEGLAIPLFWHLLDKAGNSNFQEQKALINKFVHTFGIQGIAGLLADREFGSGKFFGWLTHRKIPFYIRVKESSMICVAGKKLWKAKKVFNDLKTGEQSSFGMAVWLFGKKVFLSGSRSERGELMIVATNQPPKNAISIYLRRWEIENLFQSLKGRGFQFESTHITHRERISKLMALLAVGFAWAHKVGEWRALRKPIVIKQFRHYQAPQNTFFRYGLDYIRDAIFQVSHKACQLKQCIKIICFLNTKEALA